MEALHLFECLDDDYILVIGDVIDKNGEPGKTFQVMDLYCLANTASIPRVHLSNSSIYPMPIDNDRIFKIVQHNLAEVQILQLDFKDSDLNSQELKCTERCEGKITGSAYTCTTPNNDKYKLSSDPRRKIFTLCKADSDITVLKESPLEDREDGQVITYLGFLPDRKISKEQTHFIVIRGSEFKLWKLPDKSRDTCQLVYFRGPWVHEDGWPEDGEWSVCPHGHRFLRQHAIDMIHAMPTIVQYFNSSGPMYKKAVIELLMKHINQQLDYNSVYGGTGNGSSNDNITHNNNNNNNNNNSINNSYSNVDDISKVMSNKNNDTLIRSIIKLRNEDGAEDLLRSILDSDEFGYWIPQPQEFSIKDGDGESIIKILLNDSKFSILSILADYVLARSQINGPYFVTTFSSCLPDLNQKYPDLVLHFLQYSTFIPALNTEMLIREAIVNAPDPLSTRLKNIVKSTFSLFKGRARSNNDWKATAKSSPNNNDKSHTDSNDRRSNTLIKQNEKKKSNTSSKSETGPIVISEDDATYLYQVINSNPESQQNSQLTITRSIFDGLHYDRSLKIPVGFQKNAVDWNIKETIYVVPFGLLWNTTDKDHSKIERVGSSAGWHRVFNSLWKPLIIHTHQFELEAFDNPAFEALLNYKWDRFAQYMWSAYNYVDVCVFELRAFKAVCDVVSIVIDIITGRYDAVSTTLEEGHWTSQLMIGVFFFLTAVLMMNVIIGPQTDNEETDESMAIQDIIEKNQIETKRLMEEGRIENQRLIIEERTENRRILKEIKEQHEKENRELKKENRELKEEPLFLRRSFKSKINRNPKTAATQRPCYSSTNMQVRKYWPQTTAISCPPNPRLIGIREQLKCNIPPGCKKKQSGVIKRDIYNSTRVQNCM
ncbi:hypothetical protein BGZ76_001824 [Entomortierella beljakovae]|nr:hypothetical protein BGZ76_001824 [Entomortierella beljakovae]